MSGRYDKPDVIQRLIKDFHNKCYICEMKEMNVLYKQLEKIHKNPNSKVTMMTIRSLLRRESAFAAFKICYVREHAAEYPDLQKYVELER